MVDEDYGEKCQTHKRRTCLCGQYLLRLSSQIENHFVINNQTGEITLKANTHLDVNQTYSVSVELVGLYYECEDIKSCKFKQ